ncbi:uracil phosphoribosyltransferase [Belliella aquatica]|uniref:Uracil phosphoribosyltransferase n=1 Tax=Belliella aquatica TaxID=1323734 RepID=A0ABQ1MMH5_9BACT|nr:uracil phosphoribosyltransferase [Belliella aquatica]MCH7406042.1 uracil phosphoribosyltransferase [Belliella aquatica]GGC43192.1 uracil phosphoribosyltransferase [Belliella aquatica]
MFILNETNSIANNFLSEIRDISVHQDRLRFRKNLERLGEIMAYEISKDLDYKETEIHTPLQSTSVNTLDNQPILISVLRAALPFYQGFSNFYDQAPSGFIGAYRAKENSIDSAISIDLDYLAAPDLNGKEIILIDPMLATGKSFIKSVEAMMQNGIPKMIHIASVIAAPEGINFINASMSIPFKIWTCALDEKLNSKSYIIPGLGDAGDLAFGVKL